MLSSSIILFALAAVAGIFMFLVISRGKRAPRPVVYIHGLLAGGGLVCPLLYAFNHPENRPVASIILLLITALFGFIMFGRDVLKRQIPIFLMLVHGLVAVIGFLLLLTFFYNA